MVAWNFDSQSAVSLQIANILRLDIVNGKYKAGDSFPSVRQLACDAGVNPNTMQKSLSILENEGLLITQGTSGRIVTDNASVIDATLKKIQEDFAKKIIQEGINLGLSKDDFICLINEYYERKDTV
ncbi:MAG: GntR family transcriptional regulator [Clostridia bacterium]|nr:GntR family transcriptional regulator [Clostridia bacterium]